MKVKDLIEILGKVDDKEAPVLFEDDDFIVEIDQVDCSGYDIILGSKAT